MCGETLQWRSDLNTVNASITQRNTFKSAKRILLDLPEWSLSMTLKIISMSFLYLNRASAKFGVTFQRNKKLLLSGHPPICPLNYTETSSSTPPVSGEMTIHSNPKYSIGDNAGLKFMLKDTLTQKLQGIKVKTTISVTLQ